MSALSLVSALRTYFALFLLAIPSATPPPAQPFDLDSTSSTYPFVMRLQGTMELRGDLLTVDVRSGLVASAIPTDLGDDGIARDIRIAFGVGEPIEGGWSMKNDTRAQLVAVSLPPGEMRPIGSLRFQVSGISKLPAADRWLTARLTVKQHLPGVPAGPLSSYACSERNLLGATDASRERAAQMRKAYSHAC
jgi:hypothetical protein